MRLGFWIITALVASLSWLTAFWSRSLARKVKAVDQPTGGRKIHAKPTPLLGGIGIGAVIIVTIMVGIALGWFPSKDIQLTQLVGLMIALLILMIGGALDDRYNIKPARQIIFPLLAALVIIASGTTIHQITQWSGHGGFSLVWWQRSFAIGAWHYAISLPSDLLTLAWLLAVTYAMKFLDGLDGLVAGQTVIGAGLIAAFALSAAYSQPAVALLALIIGAAYLGFLPHNLFPAKQFLGEAGSTMAGFLLGFLAIAASAKAAVALMALGLPLADASLVVLGRLARGASPFRGDDTHLHFKLLKAGLSQRWVVFILWAIALIFGIAALGLQTRGKVLLILALVGLTCLLSILASIMRKSRVPKI